MAKTTTTEKYIETIGRRKTAIARARMTPATATSVEINNKDIKQYFVTEDLYTTVVEPFAKIAAQPFMVTVRVSGGGIAGQAVAVRHAISRALVEYNLELPRFPQARPARQRAPQSRPQESPQVPAVEQALISQHKNTPFRTKGVFLWYGA